MEKPAFTPDVPHGFVKVASAFTYLERKKGNIAR